MKLTEIETTLLAVNMMNDIRELETENIAAYMKGALQVVMTMSESVEDKLSNLDKLNDAIRYEKELRVLEILTNTI